MLYIGNKKRSQIEEEACLQTIYLFFNTALYKDIISSRHGVLFYNKKRNRVDRDEEEKKKTWQKVAYGRFLSVFLFEWLKLFDLISFNRWTALYIKTYPFHIFFGYMCVYIDVHIKNNSSIYSDKVVPCLICLTKETWQHSISELIYTIISKREGLTSF